MSIGLTMELTEVANGFRLELFTISSPGTSRK